MNCVEGAARQLDSFTPELDIDISNMRRPRINPRDFEEKPAGKNLNKRGPKPKENCPKGHAYALHGTQRKDGGRVCRVCRTARYQRRKEKEGA